MTRLLSGVILAAAALAAIWFLPLFALRIVACIVAVLAAHEYLRIAGGSAPLPALLLVALTCWSVSSPGAVVLVLLLAVGWVAVEVLWGNVPVQQAAARFLAPWYIGMPLGMLVAVHGIAGVWATLALIATVAVSDSAQYYTGRAFGRRQLAPAISPKKTIEGAIGGVMFGTLFLAIAGPWAIGAGVLAMGLLGLVVSVLGICGDLFESRLKRASGVKDSSSLIPGHGGMLDRIDALLFAIPAFYLYVR